MQIILNVIDFEQSLEEATDSKRVHHQWYPDDIDIEETYNQINELMDLKLSLIELGLFKTKNNRFSNQNMLFKYGNLSFFLH